MQMESRDPAAAPTAPAAAGVPAAAAAIAVCSLNIIVFVAIVFTVDVSRYCIRC